MKKSMDKLVIEIERGMARKGLSITGLALRVYMEPRTLYRRFKSPETFTLCELSAVVHALGWSREHLVYVLSELITEGW